MSEVGTIGLDLAKDVFQMHGANASGAATKRGARVLVIFVGRQC
jgi:hypothetical protein